MKKIISAIASIAMITICSTAAFADETEVGASSGLNVPTGIAITAVPVALAAGALTISGIVLRKKNK